MTDIVAISIISLSGAFLLWFIADRRGASTRFWAIMGADFGPLAVPFVFMTKSKASKASGPDEL